MPNRDAWPEDEKAVYVAAADRYGPTLAVKILEGRTIRGPTVSTLKKWLVAGDIVVTEEAFNVVAEMEAEQGRNWRASFASIRELLFVAIAKAIEAGEGLKSQQFMTSAGIAYDKIVPPVRAAGGGGINTIVGPGGNVNITLMAPAAVDPKDYPDFPDPKASN